jgi:hypothetical protein
MHKANNFVAHKKKKYNLIANKQLKKEHKEVGCCEADEPKQANIQTMTDTTIQVVAIVLSKCFYQL